MIQIDPESLDLSTYETLIETSVLQSYKKGDLLVEEGRTCSYLFLVEKGLLRSFYYDEKGNDVTHWFAAETMIMTSPASFFNREESFFYIQALENVEVRAITLDALEQAFEQSKSLERFGRILATEMLILFGHKIVDLQTKSAEVRYRELLQTYPDIFQRTKLGHIASYLGIAQQSLSRIRANVKL